MEVKSIKILNRKVENGKLRYRALVTPKDETMKAEEVQGQFNSFFLTNDVEIKIVDNIIMFHVQEPETYDVITKDMGIEDFSKLKRMAKDLDKTFVMNKAFQAYFKRIMGIAKKIKNTNLLKPITKTSKAGQIQFMPCWMYLCGIKKANVNYLQSDMGLKSSDYEREKSKEDAIKALLADVKKPVPKKSAPVDAKAPKKEAKATVPKAKAPRKQKVASVFVEELVKEVVAELA